jgi:hypothetical protein
LKPRADTLGYTHIAPLGLKNLIPNSRSLWYVIPQFTFIASNLSEILLHRGSHSFYFFREGQEENVTDLSFFVAFATAWDDIE